MGTVIEEDGVRDQLRAVLALLAVVPEHQSYG